MAKITNELKGYQNIPRKLIFDNTLSDRARFVYCFMASKPDGWDFFLEPMAKELKYSEETLRKYIKELIVAGWLQKGEQENIGGKFGAVEYTIKASKVLPNTENTDTENLRHGKNATQYNRYDINNRDYKDNRDIKIEDKSSKKETKIESDEDEFVEKIYSLYPSKCPKRNISLGKTYKDKDRIRKLLRTYSREDIERVVKQEVNEKYGKCYMSNFSTFLNNFPDPNSLFGKEQESTSNSNEEDMMQKFLDLPDSEQAKILQLNAYQYHMLSTNGKQGWINNRKEFIEQWFTENGQ